ncbi:adenosylcobinamide amidohydrolase [Thiorhodococcus mannitoliphagus]|uniref:Adenosylcobinamide amidohydrolase n=1 Tax=Thiorhodococcus mannitoliphagus TaxID=329406 RepID=A0A6P1DWA3_9GAMM|nr:adenosylcobinamide amidohydrolase [Thiorhodococcus mannitoliphagus]NEX19964.1 adenosylcobinamide amidohydrolase [Thiorhodococcus mannitoliphagus]
MQLEDTERYVLTRQGRYLSATFKRPHRVLSTCRINGGLREDLTHIANHQSCEGVAHVVRDRAVSGHDAYHRHACGAGELPPESTALMATAANMQCATLAQAAYEDLAVSVIATAGVLGNATRAGDPAGWHEYQDGSRPVDRAAHGSTAVASGTPVSPSESGSGTIVTLVFVNQPCTPACLVRAATMVTEGKSAAVLDLRMPSLQSCGLATGTGTDQLAIAAPLARDGDWERHWAGSHNTLGELIGRTTHAAVTRCLLLQNGLCPELRRSLTAALGRHGCDESVLREVARAELEASDAHCFEQNVLAIVHDPMSAAAAYGMAEILDLTRGGVLHAEVAREAILNQAALLAAAVAVRPESLGEFRGSLQPYQDLTPGRLAAVAVVKGFERKWT